MNIPSAGYDELSDLAKSDDLLEQDWSIPLAVCPRQTLPFDSPLHKSITPYSIHSLAEPPIHIRRLESISRQLMLRLPRLLAMVRKLNKAWSKMGTANGAVKVASDLIAVTDASSESEILHHVQVISTSGAASARVVPCPFSFDSLASFRAACFYWQTRIFTGRLCMRIRSLLDLHNLPVMAPELRGAIESEIVRMANNFTMAWEIGSRLERNRCANGVTWFGTIALWGVIQESPVIRPNLPVGAVKGWVLGRFNQKFPCDIAYDMDSMDEAAELMTGGPTRGCLCDAPRGLAYAFVLIVRRH